ncbi:lipopolysaccharide biosynthesis protein [Microbacterium sp. E-13]|uniref:lipopolysaccharide biosynthesis protein n=1 Tax=Microbacterium sp. E-13 TaxID=3404048 RepID=UPI003CEDBAD3
MRKLSTFTLVSLVGVLSPLLALPVVTAEHGARAWAAIAVGQAIGLTMGVLVELGWGLTGPQRVSRATRDSAREYLALATCTKALVFLPASLLGGATAAAMTPADPALAAASAIATASLGLTAAWYFIGRNDATALLLTEGCARIVLITAASVWILNGGPAVVYPLVGILLPGILAPILALWHQRVRWTYFSRQSWRRTRHTLLTQRGIVAARILSAAYIAVPVPLTGLLSPTTVAAFAAGDRLSRMGLSVLASVPNSMQAWVGRSGASSRKRRVWLAIGLNASIGVVSGIAFLLLAPAVSSAVFSGAATLDVQYAAGFGLLVFIVCVSRGTGNLALVAFRMTRVVTLSALLGVVLGVPSIVLLTSVFGGHGALMGVLISESVVLAVQFVGVSWRTVRARSAANEQRCAPQPTGPRLEQGRAPEPN